MSDKIVFGYREEIYREGVVEGKSLEEMKKIEFEFSLSQIY